MSRRPRLHVAGGFYHVTLRGNHQRGLFFRGEHREVLDELVSEATDRYGLKVHAFCWMTNHIHIAAEVSDVPLSKIMMWVASRHARVVQGDLVTSGHLFERRYHARLVDKDSYLLELIRYIHLNPVRAGIIHDPLLYRWSSHLAYMGIRDIPWVTCDLALNTLNRNPQTARAAYAEFIGKGVEAGFDPTILIARRREPRILGDDQFVQRMTVRAIRELAGIERRSTLQDVIGEGCERYGVTPVELKSRRRNRHLARARAWIAWRALQENVTLSAIARAFSRNESSVRELVNRHGSTFDAMPSEDGPINIQEKTPLDSTNVPRVTDIANSEASATP
jgi:putative transposase